mgnify:CR=1 FL=1
MKIVLSGVETINKGAELMLYAILQEIERKHPDAIVYLPCLAAKQGLDYFHTSLKLRAKPYTNIINFFNNYYIMRVIQKLRLPRLFLTDSHVIPNVDYFIDASGFHFSDQFNYDHFQVAYWERILTGYYKQGTKIIFLPQAFGPIQLESTRSLIQLLNKYSSIIMPREQVSYNHLLNSGVNMSKVHLFPDFTSLVKGNIRKEYSHLVGAVCIIPNMRMIDKGVVNKSDYIEYIHTIISTVKSLGYTPYILNHEGNGDKKLSYECVNGFSEDVEVVTNLNALDVKGLISSSYLVISSRFHGVASSLNSAVPCLSTSWSHKYEELYKDYELDSCVLDLKNMDILHNTLNYYLDKSINHRTRKHLISRISQLKNKTKEMWEIIWNV